MKMTGADILIQSLIDQGVDTIFGYPGGAVLFIYDALYKRSDEIRHIITSHEQGAAHAADGYARSSGKTGVVLATSGPGATNLVTGIATAYLDSIPMVAITGNVGNPLIGRDSFQEINITGITMPITKHNFFLNRVEDIAPTINKAFEIAVSGRPGPVLIDLTKDITGALGEYMKQEPHSKRQNPIPNDADINAAIEAIRASKKPLIYSGGGILAADACEELLHFAQKIDSPISTATMGLSAVPYDFPLHLGMIGMHGTVASNIASAECDCLIAIGARFSDRVAGKLDEFAPEANIIHVDIDKSEISKNVKADIGVVGDAKDVLTKLIAGLDQQDHKDWINYILPMKKMHFVIPDLGDEHPLQQRDILKDIMELTDPDNTIIATDVGQHQMFVTQHYRFTKPRSLISSLGLGTMGFGLGASIGAKVANPGKSVILISGDGSFHMNLNEVATCVSEDIPVVIVIMNNSVLGMVRQWQNVFYERRFSSTSLFKQTDYVKLAEAFGAEGYRITKRSEAKDVLRKAIASKKVCIVDCVVDIDESVYPMIAPGKGNKDMIFLED